MHPIPPPELLDAARVTSADRDEMTLSEHRTQAQQLADALHASCAYATELWQHLDAVRRYLYESLPSDPRAPGASPHGSASPTGLGDEPGWQHWIDTYASVTSILVGPHGDSGFGLAEARRVARERRDAPNLAVLTRTSATRDSTQPAQPDQPPPSESAASTIAATAKSDPMRIAGLGLLVVLALRGLRSLGRT